MIGAIGRIVGSVIRIALFALLLSVLISAALTLGMIDAGEDDGAIDTPEWLPDWPFVWEVPVDGESDRAPGPEQSPGQEEVEGDPVREDPGTTSVETGGTTVTSDDVEERIHERVNAIRSEHDLSQLDHDDEIASTARTYSHDMGERDYFSHVSPEGESPADRLDEYPSECSAVGENLALVGTRGAADADEIAERVVQGWMNSEGHRENILTARWDSQGIGVYIDGDRVYATQNFCDRR